eukprot:1087896-Alexandrium_andersonii.AAC.1
MRSASGASAPTCHSGRGARAVCAGGYPVSLASVPFRASTQCWRSQWTIYCFPTKDGSDASLTVLVSKDRDSRASLAHPVLRKGRLRDDA